jgi:hypothetical protein
VPEIAPARFGETLRGGDCRQKSYKRADVRARYSEAVSGGRRSVASTNDKIAQVMCGHGRVPKSRKQGRPLRRNDGIDYVTKETSYRAGCGVKMEDEPFAGVIC